MTTKEILTASFKELAEHKNMKEKTVVGIVAALLFVCCCFSHRRVIKALIKGEKMPKAPKWHCWVPKDKRRD